MAKEIQLANGKGIALVDDADFSMIAAHKWHLAAWRIAVTRVGYRKVQMHRMILGVVTGQYVDHINGNPLDNRRSNLRICTLRQNQHNRRMGRDNTSGRKGVYWSKTAHKWIANIKIDGRTKNLGRFEDLDAAAAAYDEAARKHFGEFAYTNAQIREAADGF